MLLTARSQHPGGVNVLLGDASVRFVDQDIDLATWQVLCTPSAIDGEVIPQDF